VLLLLLAFADHLAMLACYCPCPLPSLLLPSA